MEHVDEERGRPPHEGAGGAAGLGQVAVGGGEGLARGEAGAAGGVLAGAAGGDAGDEANGDGGGDGRSPYVAIVSVRRWFMGNELCVP